MVDKEDGVGCAVVRACMNWTMRCAASRHSAVSATSAMRTRPAPGLIPCALRASPREFEDWLAGQLPGKLRLGRDGVAAARESLEEEAEEFETALADAAEMLARSSHAASRICWSCWVMAGGLSRRWLTKRMELAARWCAHA